MLIKNIIFSAIHKLVCFIQMKSSTIIIFFITNICFSQNLIKNGDFEQGYPMTDIAYNLDSVKYWKGYCSPDYFSVDSPYPVSVFNNYFGFQIPHSGKNYCGFFSGRLGSPKLYELIYNNISSPLIKDSTYYLSFYVSLGDYMTHRANSIGVLFCQDLFFEITDMGVLGTVWIEKKQINPILIVDSTILSIDKDWTQIKLAYKAKGGERYLFIGGFDNKRESNTHLRERNYKPDNDAYAGHSYYFIDDVFLSNQEFENEININSTFSFEKINFQTNSFELSTKSTLILDPLIRFLKIAKPLEIQITGFTDSTGTKDFNKDLSLKRAESVKKYMIKNGINEDSIKTYGGDDKNINSTRRVEIEINN
jgi:OOP family OmpA-OmpF porin